MLGDLLVPLAEDRAGLLAGPDRDGGSAGGPLVEG
jgi:hypothetical protein